VTELQWVSVEDKLPEEHTDILVYFYGNKKSRHFPGCRYIKQSSYYGGRFETDDVTHWCELPNLPEE